MKKFETWFKDEYNEELPDGVVDGSWFEERRLPMIVHCTTCEMTMCIASAFISDDGYIYCHSCSGID